MNDVPSLEVEQLRDMMNQPVKPFILDVREKWENDLCKIEGSQLMPLSTLPADFARLPKDGPLVVHCHHGGRSARAVMFLQQQGYENAFNLKGGIHAWASRIDPAVKTYE